MNMRTRFRHYLTRQPSSSASLDKMNDEVEGLVSQICDGSNQWLDWFNNLENQMVHVHYFSGEDDVS